jgi:hypothetical protein
MQDGKVSLPYKRFLGYEKGEKGIPKIIESEAVIVRRIYQMYLQGKTVTTIARQLTSENILTPAGKQIWSVSTISSILQKNAIQKRKANGSVQSGLHDEEYN